MKTKNIITLSLALLLAQGVTTSCSDWLQVDSSANITEESLFADAGGYRASVNGVYRLLADATLYGQNLTWGVASVLGNNYDATRLPGMNYNSAIHYEDLAAGNYASAYSTQLIDPIWERGYKVIANCNNAIANIEKQDTSLFPYGQMERNVILGEMLGVRAMVHFDLLRLFAPSTAADDGRRYIPYVTKFPEKQPEHLTVNEVLEHVIADMESAKTLLAYCDTLFSTRMSTFQARLYIGYYATNDADFFHYHATRLNYFAAAAILARAYQWRNGAGDLERAYRAALEVYRYTTVKTWFQFTPAANLSTTEHNVFRKMPHDIIFALYNSEMYNIITAATDRTMFFYYKNEDNLFGGDTDDFRLRNLINSDHSSRRWSMPTDNQGLSPTSDVIRWQGPLAPVVRVSEMFYIMCEYLSATDLPRAIELLEQVRLARGAKAVLPASLTRAEFLEILYNEMTREFMSEGQTFYLYKRLNRPIYNGAISTDMTGRYVLPLPYSETAYI
jgi:hypothetical protein